MTFLFYLMRHFTIVHVSATGLGWVLLRFNFHWHAQGQKACVEEREQNAAGQQASCQSQHYLHGTIVGSMEQLTEFTTTIIRLASIDTLGPWWVEEKNRSDQLLSSQLDTLGSVDVVILDRTALSGRSRSVRSASACAESGNKNCGNFDVIHEGLTEICNAKRSAIPTLKPALRSHPKVFKNILSERVKFAVDVGIGSGVSQAQRAPTVQIGSKPSTSSVEQTVYELARLHARTARQITCGVRSRPAVSTRLTHNLSVSGRPLPMS